MPTHIIDASVGISTVNLSEVATRLGSRGAAAADAEFQCRSLGLDLIEVDAETAFRAALFPATQPSGLSLGDRICLATALKFAVPAVTADKAWAGIQGMLVEVIR